MSFSLRIYLTWRCFGWWSFKSVVLKVDDRVQWCCGFTDMVKMSHFVFMTVFLHSCRYCYLRLLTYVQPAEKINLC